MILHLTTAQTALVHLAAPAATTPPPTPAPTPWGQDPVQTVSATMTSLTTVTWDEFTSWLVGTPLLILVTLVVGFVARILLHRVIDRVVATATSRRAERLAAIPGAGLALQAVGVAQTRHVQRTQTMGALLKSISTFVVGGITALTVLSLVGIPLGPMLASASVGGVALAFGAQSLVKDFLSGIFMIIEDQYGVGDVIDTGEVIGTVENVSLRVTQLRDGNGMTWYVRNGEIIRIGNRTQGWSTALVDVAIAYDEDVEKATAVIREVVEAMPEDDAWKAILLEKPNVVGVESISAGAITIRIVAKTVANEQIGVQREMRERIKRAFDAAGVRSPQPVMPPYGGAAPQGTAP
ncbi:small conductance mechanosensitive channel [Humibacillus xanthopallidus]|uniref:Small conductance mechanosensitive channel n=1 Tax=Humibacillus xanthopallidus TaxID=412689 RepID=A0A543PWH3_9MICO|nr:mechanosensitive ion channel family protein [Humibacillus xanthopallidus]TQN48438.1 small conductance mechanosensitive channel [Humibacillus xanthopallidus]